MIYKNDCYIAIHGDGDVICNMSCCIAVDGDGDDEVANGVREHCVTRVLLSPNPLFEANFT
jgi:hypothetical protein